MRDYKRIKSLGFIEGLIGIWPVRDALSNNPAKIYPILIVESLDDVPVHTQALTYRRWNSAVPLGPKIIVPCRPMGYSTIAMLQTHLLDSHKRAAIEKLDEMAEQSQRWPQRGQSQVRFSPCFLKQLPAWSVFIINDREVCPWTLRIYDQLTAIQWGTIPDPFGSMVSV